MKALIKILALGSTLAVATASYALTWSDVDVIVANLTENNKTYNGSFNILDDGYNPATMKVTSAVASFAFVDDANPRSDDANEYVDIKLDGSMWKDDVEVDGYLLSFDWVSGGLSGTFLSNLQDGVLNYVVILNNTSGVNDTWLLGAKLIAEGSYKSGGTTGGGTRVPDSGATVGLLGLGLFLLALARRRTA